MKKIWLWLAAALVLCSCGNQKISRHVCGFIEEATEQTEEAATLDQVERINERLTRNIMMYFMAVDKEQYAAWEKDAGAQQLKEEATRKYLQAMSKRKQELGGE